MTKVTLDVPPNPWGQRQIRVYTSGREKRFRLDTVNSDATEITFIVDGEDFLACSDDARRILEEPSRAVGAVCARTSLNEDTNTAASYGTIPIDVVLYWPYAGYSSDARIDRIEGKTILGRPARCYRLSLRGYFSSPVFDVCLTNDHSLGFVGNGNEGYLASAIEDASSADFEPPYPIFDRN